MKIRNQPRHVQIAYWGANRPVPLADEALTIATIDGLEEAGFHRDLFSEIPCSEFIDFEPEGKPENYFAMTLREIGEIEGCGPERIRQIICSAFWKLRSARTPARKILEELAEDDWEMPPAWAPCSFDPDDD